MKLTWAALGAISRQRRARGCQGRPRRARRQGQPAGIRTWIAKRRAKALLGIKASHDSSPLNAYLDLEEKKSTTTSRARVDVWASLSRSRPPRARPRPRSSLLNVSVPAVTKKGLGIDDISVVLGHHLTKFAATDLTRNFNLKLAASKINGAVLPPNVEWPFNQQVGERLEKEGYKIACT